MAILIQTMRHAKWLSGVLFVIVIFLFSSGLNSSAQTTKEYEVKAAFLYNFAQFVEWPPEAFSNAQAPLVIGILGDDPFGTYLDEVVRGEKTNDRPFVIQRYRRLEDVKACHILFISQSETKRLEEILTGLKSRGILTVGDTENFTKNGGMIQFVTEKNKIRFQINVEATKAANLTISSKLLRLAKIVGPGKD